MDRSSARICRGRSWCGCRIRHPRVDDGSGQVHHQFWSIGEDERSSREPCHEKTSSSVVRVECILPPLRLRLLDDLVSRARPGSSFANFRSDLCDARAELTDTKIGRPAECSVGRETYSSLTETMARARSSDVSSRGHGYGSRARSYHNWPALEVTFSHSILVFSRLPSPLGE